MAALALHVAAIDLAAELVTSAAAGLHRLTIRTHRPAVVRVLRFLTAGLVGIADDLNGRAIRCAAELDRLEREVADHGG